MGKWRGRLGFALYGHGLCRFRAQVAYCSRGTRVVHVTNVAIQRHGSEDGKVSLTADPPLIEDLFHLDFSPKFQQYRLDTKSNSLIIKGRSDKMGGDYAVVITPQP